MDNLDNGYLEIILGPMFSGKTSKLIEIYKQYRFCEIDVLVVNHAEDIRYSSHSMNTHDNIAIDCISIDNIRSLINEKIDIFTSKKPLAVLINEGQFFNDLYTSVYEMVNIHKTHVYIGGLDGDYKREKFGQLLDLIPICDKVYKLHSLCYHCKNGSRAIFSYRTDKKSLNQKHVGASECYIPLCRKCYNAS